MTDEFLIRPLAEEHIEVFLTLRSDALLHSPESFGSDYESYSTLSILDREELEDKILNYPYNFVLGAFTPDNLLVGMVGFSVRLNKSKQRHKGYIWGMYVTPEFRRKGVGKQLLSRLLPMVREDADSEQILLSIASSNNEAYRLYQEFGFIQYGTEIRALKLADGRYIDEILMIRLLD